MGLCPSADGDHRSAGDSGLPGVFTKLGCTVKVIHPQQKFDVCFPDGWDMTLERVGDTKGAVNGTKTTFGDDGHSDPIPHVAHLYDPTGRQRGIYTFGFGGSEFLLTTSRGTFGESA